MFRPVKFKAIFEEFSFGICKNQIGVGISKIIMQTRCKLII